MAYSKKLKQVNKSLRISDETCSLHKEILDVIMVNGFLIKQENWNESQMEMRATYDSFRIINLVNNHLNKK